MRIYIFFYSNNNPRVYSCAWDSTTCAFAAIAGHLSILMWARENGCEWDEDMSKNYEIKPHVKQWAIANGLDV